MCGIVGILDNKQTPDRDLLEKMNRIMHHRGPDGEGYYLKGPVALGHRRLSIIDLSGGAQPLSNEDGSVWVTFNGEIYNFPSLRDDLIRRGHTFKTRSDTETIVHAWEEWGEGCPKQLRGMFAFAVWDAPRKTLFMARDRMGKKPLYYHAQGDRFLFGSEIKALLQDPRVTRNIDPDSLVDYLNYHYIPFPKTIFKGIHKLEPGHSLTVRLESIDKDKLPGTSVETLRISSQPYWKLEYRPDPTRTEEEWVEELRKKLEEAVKIRLISEVPLGAFLSGGIDSSTVVALMSRIQSSPVKTFSIGFKEEDFSELKYARKISELFKTDHHEYVVEPDAMEVLPKLAWEFDEPFADSSAIPTYYVSKLARENVTVILSGDGGDETFAGYRRYRWANDMGRYDWLPQWARRTMFGMPAALMPEGLKGKGTLQHLSRDPFERYAGLNTFGENGYLRGLLSPDLTGSLGSGKKLPDYSAMRRFYDDCLAHDYLTRIQYVDTKTYLAEDILTKVDRASMLCSLETRAPLLDHEVVELAARIPPELKLKRGETKYILKKAMKGILPDNILYRRKMGFGVPLVHWFKKDLVEYARDILLSRQARERGIFETHMVEKLLQDHGKAGRDLSARIWALLFFEHWSQNWL